MLCVPQNRSEGSRWPGELSTASNYNDVVLVGVNN